MALEVIVITGMSGSGKSVALHALEDAGYYCVDNLPPELLGAFTALEHAHHGHRAAVAMDVRSATGLPLVPRQLEQLRAGGVAVRSLFLDASTDTLVRRFSETRRRHPLSSKALQDGQRALVQTIELERELLAELREHSQVIDTSTLRPAQLLGYVKSLLPAAPDRLNLVFQSFAFKRGVPLDADYVFDVRMLPNPHYEPLLRPLTGRDRARGRIPGPAARGAADAGAHQPVPGPVAGRHGAQPPQLRHRGNRLHRRPAPLGVPGRAAGTALCPALEHAAAPPRARWPVRAGLLFNE